MTQPMDPNAPGYAGRSEYSWGKGMFPPGTADTVGPDYNDPHYPQLEDRIDNYARAVADRRTDSTDPSSGRDFFTAGNPDRYGANPPLIKESATTEPGPPLPTIPTGVERAE